MNPLPRRFAPGAGLVIAFALLAAAARGDDEIPQFAGRVVFADPRNPPPWTEMHPAARRDFDLGQLIFNSPWFPAGHADAAVRDGLGPLFVQPSCDGCHGSGARSRPAAVVGTLANGFVLQLGGPSTPYGHVLNTRAIEGHAPEARIEVTLRERSGRYADGRRWKTLEPRHRVLEGTAGPLPAATVLKPRIAPAVYGVGLLDGVPPATVDAIRQQQPESLRGSPGGRFGWQGDARGLVDQTALALAREMGVTSDLQPQDDCTATQTACREAQSGGTPEISERFFHALNTYQFMIGVPARAPMDAGVDAAGAALFASVGCAACHAPRLTVPREGDTTLVLDPYSDLMLHDLGEGLADRTIAGHPVQSRWRTAPLWGLSHALRSGPVALLHDGRARNVEEAILWHDGQAAAARGRFVALDAARRRQLLEWVATL